MELIGDPEGIQVLKAMHAKNKGFMRALLEDVRSTTDRQTYFRDEHGRRYRLTLVQPSGDLRIEPAATTPPPPKVG